MAIGHVATVTDAGGITSTSAQVRAAISEAATPSHRIGVL